MSDLSDIGACLSDLDGMIVSIFDAEPVAAQPKYIVSLACGDDLMLKRVCEVVRQKTLRGRMRDAAPITCLLYTSRCV